MWTLRTICLTGIIAILAACSSKDPADDDDDNDNDTSATGGKGAGASSSTGTSTGNTTGTQTGTDTGGNSGTNTSTTTSGGTMGQGGNGAGNVASNGGEGSSTGGEGAGAAGGKTCINIEAATSAVPAVLEFVIDNTGSFQDDAYPADATKNATKWEEILRVIPESIRSLPAKWAVGTTYYNLSGSTSDSNACYQGSQASPIDPLTPEHVDGIIAAMPTIGVGATPTYSAWQYGLQQLIDWVPPSADYEKSPRYVVLITDGIPTVKNNGCYAPFTCDDPPPEWEPATPLCAVGELVRSDGRHAISEAEYDRMLTGVKEKSEVAGYKTYVVGVLGSEDGQGAIYDPLYKLSQFATAGGTAEAGCEAAAGTMWVDPDSTLYSHVETRGTYCHMDMTTNENFAEGLQAGLKKIVTSLVSCTYDVPASGTNEPVDYDQTHVTYYVAGDLSDPAAAQTLLQNKNGETDPTCPERTVKEVVIPAGSGWYYSEYNEATGEPSKLSLCPDSCETVRADLDAQLKVVFECIIVG